MLLLVANSVNASVSMSKSNPAALSGILQNEEQVESLLESFPLPENADEPTVDSYTLTCSENTQRYFKSMEKRSGSTTPRQVSGSLSTSHQWSDCTLTRSFSGRYSTCSWGAESADEAEFDRAATEQVRRKFDKINGALYEGKTTGTDQVDQECKEWSSTFPHLMVQGIHLLDTMDDGTEMVEPNVFSMMTPFDDFTVQTHPPESQEIAIVGRTVEPIVLQDIPEHERLKEEVIAADGIVEEYFAFDSRDNDSHENSRRSRLKRYRGYRGLPPLTPNACVKDTVRSLVFDHIWSEVISVLQPLCAAIRERASQGHNSCYSLGNDQLTPTHSPLGISPLQHEPYYFRGLRDQPTLTKAPGQSGSQFLRFKYSTPSLISTLPQLNNLSGVMQIKPVSLQQRTSMMMPISREGTPTLFTRPESSAVISRLVKNTTPLPPKLSDIQLPTTPAHNRLISSRLTNRRNVMTLKPLERSKTPALVPIDNGIRGYKLNTNLSHGSPPTTPFIRNNQLPPLELTTSGGPTSSSVAVDRSPPTQLKTSAQSRNRVTFNSRVVSAADEQDSWRTLKPSGTDLRPNTTTNSYRQHSTQEGSSRGIMRKMSDHSMSFGRMKIVGIGTGHHSFASSTGSNVGLSGLGSEYSRTNGIIAEDEEIIGDTEESSFTITGTSRFLQSKPRSISGRSKLRGHIR